MLLTVKSQKLFDFANQAGWIGRQWSKGNTSVNNTETILFILADIASALLFAVPKAIAAGTLETALGDTEIIYEDDNGIEYRINYRIDENYIFWAYAISIAVVAITVFATVRGVKITKNALGYINEIWKNLEVRSDLPLAQSRFVKNLDIDGWLFKTLASAPDFLRLSLKVLGLLDIITFGATALIRIFGDDLTKAQRQGVINQAIKITPFLNDWLYQGSDTPAQDYGLDFPIGLLDLVVWPIIVNSLIPFFGRTLPEPIQDFFKEAGSATFSVALGILISAIEIIAIELSIPRFEYNLTESFTPESFTFDLDSQFLIDSNIAFYAFELWFSAIVLKSLYRYYAQPLWRMFQSANV